LLNICPKKDQHAALRKEIFLWNKRVPGFSDMERNLNGRIYGTFINPHGETESGFYEHDKTLNKGQTTRANRKRVPGFSEMERN
jgi:hypothetical protein